ncbi:MAG: DsrE/DsrF/DrsH-like family protein, partial [Acidobacteria bacterium]|nr:DsrE/DsrF/DrsH-like family protein [Acidobacteriota bacterium]
MPSVTYRDRPKRLALIASKGTLDWAYPPFILASTAAAAPTVSPGPLGG